MWWQRHLSEFVTFFLVVNPFGVLAFFLGSHGQGLPVGCPMHIIRLYGKPILFSHEE